MGKQSGMSLSLSEEQLDDLARLLAKCLGQGSIYGLATAVMGPEAIQDAANDVGDVDVFAAKVVRALHAAGCIPTTVEVLLKEGHRNGLLTLGVNHILNGKRLDSDEALQQFVNDHEPFLSNAAMMALLPRIGRTVCAVALGKPLHKIMGTGFLIAPEIVMTNYHVLEPFLKVDPATKEITQNGPGDEIFFFFDYLHAPPPDVSTHGKGHASLCVTAAQDWLLKARLKLENDGAAKSPTLFNNEFDYAAVRLQRPVGNQVPRRSGGAIRGWLPPEDSIDVLSPKQRILVFQHPGAAEQQFDIGDYVQLDPTRSRVWYTVSTAKGSSGGAAVDTEGRLFALHNAEVKAAVPAANGKAVNQGVRIDRIAQDLGALVPRTPVPADDGTSFWSLNDDLKDSHPIIGRKVFRDLVVQIGKPQGERVLVVTGPPESGLNYSIKLLRRTLGRNVPVPVFSPQQLQQSTPQAPQVFLTALVRNLGVGGLSGKPMPELLTTENVPGWLNNDLPRWLLEALSKDEARNPTKYPAWVVINTVVPKDESFLWADHLRDLIAALVGVRDPGSPVIELPQLRWLFLVKEADAGTNPVVLPLGGVKHLTEDLGSDNDYLSDFTECLRLAWRSNSDDFAAFDAKLMKLIGSQLIQLSQKLPPKKRIPPRKVLADAVRGIIQEHLRGGAL
jgi:hypothetical protein